MTNKVPRRQMLALVATGSAAAVAGCSSADEYEGQEDHDTPFPEIGFSTESDWESFEENREVHESQYTVTPYEATRMFEQTELREEINTLSDGEFDDTLAIFFASHIHLEGIASFGASESRIADILETDFRTKLEEQNIESVENAESITPQPEPTASAELREFQGTYQTPPIEEEIPLEGQESTTVTIDESAISIRAFFTVWKEDSSTAFAAGGIYPDDDFEERDRVSITGSEYEGIDAGVFVNLPMRSTEIRQQMVDLVETVTVSS